MTVKVRDATGVLRTIDSIKVRGPDNVLRTVDFVRVRGADKVLREVFTMAGGGTTPPPNNPASITPGDRTTASRATFSTGYFTAMSSAAAPSAYAWSVIDGPGAVVSGGQTNSAQLRINAAPGTEETATFACDMTISGTVYRATCSMSHYNTSGSGGQPQL